MSKEYLSTIGLTKMLLSSRPGLDERTGLVQSVDQGRNRQALWNIVK